MKEVSGPVIGIALILSSVFLPIAFMGGIQGRLNEQFALTIAIAVLISAFNALTLSPALAALLLRPKKPSKGLFARFFGGFNQGVAKATRGYVDWSHALIRKAALALLFLVAVGVVDAVMSRKLPASFLPEEDYGYAFLNVQLPAAASLARTDQVLKKVEGILGQTEGVGSYVTVGGFSLLTRISASYQGFFFVSVQAVGRAAVEAACGARHCRSPERDARSGRARGGGICVHAAVIPDSAMPAVFLWLQDRSGGSVEFPIRIFRSSWSRRQRPELAGVASQFSTDVPQIYADVDRDKALNRRSHRRRLPDAAGLSRWTVSESVQPLRPSMARVLAAEGAERKSAEDIRNYYVRNDKDTMVPLSGLVTTRSISGPETPTVSICIAPRRSSAAPRPVTVPVRRWPHSTRWPKRSSHPRWATTGPISHTRRGERLGPR
jgi:HAE1 family hydrophobic/amphiphilic exporter-1